VVVAGEGPAADAKARLFEGSPARVVRLRGAAALSPEAYAGATLVFVASDDESFIAAATAAARGAATPAPVNVADHPELCDFTTPAVIDRGEVVAAIGTGGASPMLATLLRQDIEARVPEGAGRVAALFRSLQDEVRQALPEPHLRRAFLRAALTGPAAQAAMAGDLEAAKAKLRQALAEGVAPQGRVTFVLGAGPAERLTLAAGRALAAADALAPDAGVDAEVMGLARRDAERLSPDQATPEQLSDLTVRGLHVVRVTAGAADLDELRDLAELGVDVQTI
jgi:precorrin-2 dehydrogenase/sirohydrochlorin ferrochelatase